MSRHKYVSSKKPKSCHYTSKQWELHSKISLQTCKKPGQLRLTNTDLEKKKMSFILNKNYCKVYQCYLKELNVLENIMLVCFSNTFYKENTNYKKILPFSFCQSYKFLIDFELKQRLLRISPKIKVSSKVALLKRDYSQQLQYFSYLRAHTPTIGCTLRGGPTSFKTKSKY